MSNNFGDDPVHAEPDPNYKPPVYEKSVRELKIEGLCAQLAATPNSEELRKELLKTIEGAEFFLQHSQKKIVLFNGAPRAGKDTSTEFAMSYLGERGTTYRFAAPLKDAIHALFGLNDVKEEHFNSTKETPNPIFYDMTPRQAYIWLSEEVVKPKFGSDFFARAAVRRLTSIRKPVIIVSDCGFEEEAELLTAAFGAENVLVVHIERDGCDFSNDSRNYIMKAACKYAKLENNGTVHDLYENVVKILDDFAPAD